jgi:hypothetical protein
MYNVGQKLPKHRDFIVKLRNLRSFVIFKYNVAHR